MDDGYGYWVVLVPDSRASHAGHDAEYNAIQVGEGTYRAIGRADARAGRIYVTDAHYSVMEAAGNIVKEMGCTTASPRPNSAGTT